MGAALMGFHVPSWFYVFAGVVLVISGIAQIVMRAKAGEGFARPGTIFSVVSVILGGVVMYFGLFVHH
jgi:uncharacterized membrane protein HdeD (DUF308 family)